MAYGSAWEPNSNVDGEYWLVKQEHQYTHSTALFQNDYNDYNSMILIYDFVLLKINVNMLAVASVLHAFGKQKGKSQVCSHWPWHGS